MKKIVKQQPTFLDYLKQTFWQFIDHVKINKKILLIAIYDLIFWLLFFGTSYVISTFIKKETSMLGTVNFNQFQILTSQELTETNLVLIKTFLIKSAIILLIFFLTSLVIYSIAKALIWLTLFNKKPTKEFMAGFIKIHFIWWILWTLPILFSLIGAQPEWRNYFVIFFFFFYLHSTTILQTVYTQKCEMKEAFTSVLNKGIAKIHKFILPYAFALIIYFLLTRILLLLPRASAALLASAIIIGLIYISWFRYYIKDVILEA